MVSLNAEILKDVIVQIYVLDLKIPIVLEYRDADGGTKTRKKLVYLRTQTENCFRVCFAMLETLLTPFQSHKYLKTLGYASCFYKHFFG